MKLNIKFFEPLNLIYYEYDARTNSLRVNNMQSSYDYSMELVSITNFLQQKKINYIVDKGNNVIITSENSLTARFKRYIKSSIDKMRCKRLNIYVLSNQKVKMAKNLPMFEIKTLKSEIDFSLYEALIFTSRNAVLSINEIDKEWKCKPAYAIAAQTAKVIKSLKGQLRFVGKTQYGDKFALEIMDSLKGKKVLYLRGKEVVSNMAEILNENGVDCDECIIYENVPKVYDKKIKLPKNSTIIFSSPSTVRSFLNNADWDESYKAVAIGNTTAEAFPKYIVPTIADATSYDSCVSKAIEINS